MQRGADEASGGVGCFIAAFVLIPVLLYLVNSNVSKAPPVQSYTSPATSATRADVKSDYVRDEARLRELGRKYHPTREEIRELLILDARQSVREGSMSRSQYEQWTHERFPD